MAKKSNLDSGFLLLYDWLPAIENLPAKEVKALLLALIARQRENKPLPLFHNALTASYARMIEPCIKRRLDGLAAAKKEAEQGRCGGEGATPPRGEETREEKETAKHSFSEQSSGYGGKKSPSGGRGRSSFDVEEFFTAALEQTYGKGAADIP